MKINTFSSKRSSGLAWPSHSGIRSLAGSATMTKSVRSGGSPGAIDRVEILVVDVHDDML